MRLNRIEQLAARTLMGVLVAGNIVVLVALLADLPQGNRLYAVMNGYSMKALQAGGLFVAAIALLLGAILLPRRPAFWSAFAACFAAPQCLIALILAHLKLQYGVPDSDTWRRYTPYLEHDDARRLYSEGVAAEHLMAFVCALLLFFLARILMQQFRESRRDAIYMASARKEEPYSRRLMRVACAIAGALTLAGMILNILIRAEAQPGAGGMAIFNVEVIGFDLFITTAYIFSAFSRTSRTPAVITLSLSIVQLASIICVHLGAFILSDWSSLVFIPHLTDLGSGVNASVIHALLAADVYRMHLQLLILLGLAVCALRVICGYDGAPREVPPDRALTGNRAAGITLALSCGVVCAIAGIYQAMQVIPEISRMVGSPGATGRRIATIAVAIIAGLLVAAVFHISAAWRLSRRKASPPLVSLVLASLQTVVAMGLLCYYFLTIKRVLGIGWGVPQPHSFLLSLEGAQLNPYAEWNTAADSELIFVLEYFWVLLLFAALGAATLLAMARVLREKSERLFPVEAASMPLVAAAPVIAVATESSAPGANGGRPSTP